MNVITFEFFFEHHLDPAMKRWLASKVIALKLALNPCRVLFMSGYRAGDGTGSDLAS